MTYTVQTLNPDGSGYLVITLDDGKSFGQNFRGVPVDDAAAFDAAIQQIVDRAVMAVTATAPTVASAVMAKVGQSQSRQQPTQGRRGG